MCYDHVYYLYNVVRVSRGFHLYWPSTVFAVNIGFPISRVSNFILLLGKYDLWLTS